MANKYVKKMWSQIKTDRERHRENLPYTYYAIQYQNAVQNQFSKDVEQWQTSIGRSVME